MVLLNHLRTQAKFKIWHKQEIWSIPDNIYIKIGFYMSKMYNLIPSYVNFGENVRNHNRLISSGDWLNYE